jgi:hypothetical protein
MEANVFITAFRLPKILLTFSNAKMVTRSYIYFFFFNEKTVSLSDKQKCETLKYYAFLVKFLTFLENILTFYRDGKKNERIEIL